LIFFEFDSQSLCLEISDITIFLNYNDQALPAITKLTFVSKPERSIKFKKTKRDNQKNPLSSSFFRAQFSQQKYGELAFIIR